MRNKTVLILSPLKDNNDTTDCRTYYRQSLELGVSPIVAALPINQNSNIAGKTDYNCEVVDICDEIWLFGPKITAAMALYMKRAAGKKKPVYCKSGRLLDEQILAQKLRNQQIAV